MGATIKTGQQNFKYKRSVAQYFAKKNKYWKEIYNPKYQQGNLFINAHMRSRKETVLKFVDNCAKEGQHRILDLGCGTGALMKEMLARGHQVVGADLCRDMLTEAKETVNSFASKAVTFSLADVEKLPFKDNSFDIVTCIGVIEYLSDENIGIKEIRRVIRTGGYLIVSLPNVFKLNNLLDPYFYFNRGIKYLVHKIKHNRNGTGKIIAKEDDLSTNDNFINKRYFRMQIVDLFKKFQFCEIDNVSLGFGPPKFFQKEIYSYNTSVRITNYLENLSRKKAFSFMNYFPNRWVLCEQKKQN